MIQLFDQSSLACSAIITRTYSTSFSIGIRLLDKRIRPAIYAIYGFVRCADEIVDTFHDFDKEELLEEFIDDYHKALTRRISLNPVLHAFQDIVHRYDLQPFVHSFLESMRADLHKSDYLSQEAYKKYIYGSADAVGLMCLRVFIDNDEEKFQALRPYAERLGSAFQKVNFLRDLGDDYQQLGRAYFPDLTIGELTEDKKQTIIQEIESDFDYALEGIQKLPVECRLGVYVAYCYYRRLLRKLKKTPAHELLVQRTRISNPKKIVILCESYFKYKTKLTLS